MAAHNRSHQTTVLGKMLLKRRQNQPTTRACSYYCIDHRLSLALNGSRTLNMGVAKIPRKRETEPKAPVKADVRQPYQRKRNQAFPAKQDVRARKVE
jgi:hypothetical protein